MFRLATIALLCMTVSAIELTATEELDAAEELEVDEWLNMAEEEDREPTAKEIMGFFDKNGNGAISKKEFFAGLMKIAKMHNYKPTKKDKKMASKLFDKADQNGNGEVDMKELKAAIAWCKKNMK